MNLTLPRDLEDLVAKRLSTGGYADVEDVLRRALETQDALERWTSEETRAIEAHLEAGFQRAERGQLVDGDSARREMQEMKREWVVARSPSEQIRTHAARVS